MTDQQRNEIIRLQHEGLGYKRIAAELNLPVNGVKSFCRRHPVTENSETPTSASCLQCGATLQQLPHRKVKKFCSDKCRTAWWNANPNRVNRKAYYTFICPTCGQPFSVYGKKRRVYCSRACYAQARRKEVTLDE